MTSAPAEQFTIPKRWSWLSSVTVEISCDPLTSIPIKLGLAVRAAFSTGADLTGAVLRGADLRGADLTGAVLRGADLRGEKIKRIIAIAQRLDGYTFYAFEMEGGAVKIQAGCRWFTPPEFRAHVLAEYPDTDKAKETNRILDLIEGRMVDLGISAKEVEK